MVMFPKTYTSAMRKTASMPANLSNIDLQQSVKRTQRDCEQINKPYRKQEEKKLLIQGDKLFIINL